MTKVHINKIIIIIIIILLLYYNSIIIIIIIPGPMESLNREENRAYLMRTAMAYVWFIIMSVLLYVDVNSLVRDS